MGVKAFPKAAQASTTKRNAPVRLVHDEHLELARIADSCPGPSTDTALAFALLVDSDTAASEQELFQSARRADEDVGAGLEELFLIILERVASDQEECGTDWRRARRRGRWSRRSRGVVGILRSRLRGEEMVEN